MINNMYGSSEYPETIKLEYLNRDRAQLWWEREYDNVYSIHTTEDKDFVLKYMTMSFTELSNDATDYDSELSLPEGTSKKVIYNTCDPSGGPYMQVGEFKIGPFKLVRIFRDKKLLFKFIRE